MRTNSSTACSCDSALIDVIGLCNPGNVTEVIKGYFYWKQMYIPETLEIPSTKPDIEAINSVNISVNIIRKQVIKTPISYSDATPPVAMPNLEGMLLSGRKLIIEGQLCQKIVYTANVVEQPVHSVHFYVPFSSYIVVLAVGECTKFCVIGLFRQILGRLIVALTCREDRAMLGSNPSARRVLPEIAEDIIPSFLPFMTISGRTKAINPLPNPLFLGNPWLNSIPKVYCKLGDTIPPFPDWHSPLL